jgi:hypothetical protein
VVAPCKFYKNNGDEYESDIEYLYYDDSGVFEKDDIPSDVKLYVREKRD